MASNLAPSPSSRPTRAAAAPPLLALLAGLFLAGAQPVLTGRSASAQRPDDDPQGLIESVNVLVGASEVFARLRLADGAPSPRVDAELWDASGQLLAADQTLAAGDGGVELDLGRGGLGEPRPVSLLPGHRLRLSTRYPDGRQAAREVEVAAVGVELGPEGLVLRGWGPPGHDLSIITSDAAGGFDLQETAAEADGRWSVTLPGDMDLGPGSSGTVLLSDGDGLSFQAAWTRPKIALPAGASEIELHLRPGEVVNATLSERFAGDLLERARGTVIGRGSPVRLSLGGGGILTSSRLTLAYSMPEHPLLPDRPDDQFEFPLLEAALDLASDTVFGTTAPNGVLDLTLRGRPADPLRVMADDEGRWLARWAGTLFSPEDAVEVRFPDAPAFSLVARVSTLTHIDPLSAWVQGTGVAGQGAELKLYDDPPEGVAFPCAIPIAGSYRHVDADGRFTLGLVRGQAGSLGGRPWNAQGHDARWASIVAGESLEFRFPPLIDDIVCQRGWSFSHIDHHLAVDADADTIGGHAEPGTTIQVLRGGESFDLGSPVDAPGAWSLDLAGRADLHPGDELTLRAVDLNGVDRGLSFLAPRLNARIDAGQVIVEGQPGLAVDLEWQRAGQVMGQSGCVVERRSCAAQFPVPESGASPFLPGDSVLAFADRAASASLQLVKMTAHIDPTGRDVTGQAPKDDAVEIRFGNDGGTGLPSGTRIGTDDTGVYDYELGVGQWDLLVPGLVADVFFSADSGHRTAARGLLEALHLPLGTDRVEGWAEPLSEVRVEVFAAADLDAAGRAKPGASPRRTKTTHADSEGRFSAEVGRPAMGELVRMAHRRGERAMVVPPLAAWAWNTAWDVAGVTSPLTRVRARYLLRGLEHGEVRAVDGLSDGDGRFHLRAPVVHPEQLAGIQVAVLGGDGEAYRIVGWGPPRQVWLPSIARPAAGP